MTASAPPRRIARCTTTRARASPAAIPTPTGSARTTSARRRSGARWPRPTRTSSTSSAARWACRARPTRRSARRAAPRLETPRFVSDLTTRLDAPRRVAGLTEAARRATALRPQWRNGRVTLRRRHPVSFLEDHRWSLLGVAAGILAAGVWGLWRREPGQVRLATTIDAPIERVFDAWSRFEDFPRFMPMVAEVRSVGEDRWHWVIAGPAGAPIEFDSVVTRRERPRLIAWQTVEGALVEHSGTARFRPTADGGTRV